MSQRDGLATTPRGVLVSFVGPYAVRRCHCSDVDSCFADAAVSNTAAFLSRLARAVASRYRAA